MAKKFSELRDKMSPESRARVDREVKRLSAKLHAPVDPEKYGQLLMAILPKPIKSKDEHERMLGEIAKLEKDAETPEEIALLGVLGALVEDYDRRHL